MFAYPYTTRHGDETSTSSSSSSQTSSSYETIGYITTLYEDLLLTTATYLYTYTESSTTNYTVLDGTATSTDTCDYSVSVSSQSQSGATTTDVFSSTSTYATTHHSTNGTHSITTSSKVASIVADLNTFYTQSCAYTYYTTETASGSTDYGNYSESTYRTTTHDIFSTHSVSERTVQATLASTNSGSITEECDYLAPSTQSTSQSSAYFGYSASTSYTTTHDIYSIGIHTIKGSTVEVSTSNVTTTISSTLWTETTSTTLVVGYGNTYITGITFHTENQFLTESAIGTSTTRYYSSDFTHIEQITTNQTGLTANWFSYTLNVIFGDSIGYERDVASRSLTATFYSYASGSGFSAVTADTSSVQSSSEFYSTSTQSSFYETVNESITFASVNLGVKEYTTTTNTTSSSFATTETLTSQSTFSSYDTRVTSTLFVNYATSTISVSGFGYANRTTAIGIATSTMVAMITNSAGKPTTSTFTFTGTRLSTQTTTSTVKSYASYTVSPFTDSVSVYVGTKYTRLDGEVLLVATLTQTGTWRVTDAAYTTVSFENLSGAGTFTSGSTFTNPQYTYQWNRTLTKIAATAFGYSLDSPSLSMSPNNVSNYENIYPVYPAFDFFLNNQNQEYSIWGIQAYNATGGTTQGVSYGAGAFDVTYGSVTAQQDYSAVGSFIAPVEARKIHPRITVAITNTSAQVIIPIAYSTSNTIRLV